MAWFHTLADQWWPLFALHMAEISLFLAFVALVDRLLKLSVSTRYALWVLALAKVFVPPFLAVPAPLPERFAIPALFPGVFASNATVLQANAAFSPYPLLFGLWLVSAVFILGVMVKRHLQLRQSLEVATPIVPLPLTGCQVFETRAVVSPMLTGLLRTRLYLPQDWRAWSPQQLQAILRHETAHLRGRDLWVLGMESAALVLFGLNPLVWLLRRRLAYLRELRCDMVALSESGISALDYSKLLYAFAEKQLRPAPAMSSGIAFAAQQSTLYKRLQHLLTRKESEMKAGKFRQAALFGFMGVVMMMLSWQCSELPKQVEKTPVSPERGSNVTAAAPQDFDQPPDVTFFQTPKYPEPAKQAGYEGEIFLQLTIAADGKITKMVPIKAAITKKGMPTSLKLAAPEEKVDGVSVTDFVNAAIEAAHGFKFKPALLKGKPVESQAVVPFKFKLEQSVGALTPRAEVELC
ncbi:M56 family metallopeptidase [candidate division KSB1 bacterium]|nr:M56 family metallopeptidase [candidate division KSB1 bacterium]